MDNLQHDILVKLGSAIYLHKKMASVAESGLEAIKYLKEKGVFDDLPEMRKQQD